MLIDIYIILQTITFVLFFVAYFAKQEIIWAIVLVLSGMLMFSSNLIETYTYSFNVTLGAYIPYMQSNSYPYLSGLNVLLFGLSVVFIIFDIWSKYGTQLKSGDR